MKIRPWKARDDRMCITCHIDASTWRKKNQKKGGTEVPPLI
jgi:hypothetical protein